VKLTFFHASLKALWDEAIRQWPISVRPVNGHSSPGFWLVGDEGIYLTHNGAKPSSGRPTVAYANECDPLKTPFQNWLALKRAIFDGAGGMEFVELVVIGTAVDARCDVEMTLDPNVMTVTILEQGRPSLRWQTHRSRHAARLTR
jgi:hypothetical protein